MAKVCPVYEMLSASFKLESERDVLNAILQKNLTNTFLDLHTRGFKKNQNCPRLLVECFYKI